MGVFRLALAALVVFEHAPLFGNIRFVSGHVAVEMFFMLSGFYMALVLGTKYDASSWQGRKVFYASRLLRLWPVFVLTVLATHAYRFAVYLWLGHPPVTAGPVLEWAGPWATAAIRLSDLVMIGQDVFTWFHVDASGDFFLTFGSARHAPGALWLGNGRAITPAWSIGTEIWFYLLAPWLVRARTSTLLGIATAGLALRAWMAAAGLWSYLFFPAQLPLFLAGVLVYRFREARWLRARHAHVVPAAVVIVLSISALFVSVPDAAKWMGIVLVAAGLPALFERTKHYRVDRMLGELSYPVYLVHVLVYVVTVNVGSRLGGEWHGEVVLPISVLVAYLLYRYVEQPVDAWRQSLARKAGPQTPQAPAPAL